MLANNIATAAPIAASADNETEIVLWTADGLQGFLGFMGTGSSDGTFTLYVKRPLDASPLPFYIYQTAVENKTAYVADRFIVFPVGTTVSLRAAHLSANPETFYGTLLGGEL